MRTALVVPTNRPESLERFASEWRGATWDDVIVVFDGPEDECRLDWPEARIYCWEDYERLCGDRAWIFSRRDSACRCFGFLQAVARGAEAVITLDDDCYPDASWDAESFVGEHTRRLEAAPRWTSSVPGLRVRGLPTEGEELSAGGLPVAVNMGLWTGVADLSAKDSLAARERGDDALLEDFVPPAGTRVASPRQVFPFSGMNFAFRRAMLPALFFPRMGRGTSFGRFDDIWCGLVLQRVCAAAGELITVGEPWVRHARASDVDANLRTEAPGAAVNARFWRRISELEIEGDDVASCTASAARALAASDEPYLVEWGRSLATWISLSREAAAEPRRGGAAAAVRPTGLSAAGVPRG